MAILICYVEKENFLKQTFMTLHAMTDEVAAFQNPLNLMVRNGELWRLNSTLRKTEYGAKFECLSLHNLTHMVINSKRF